MMIVSMSMSSHTSATEYCTSIYIKLMVTSRDSVAWACVLF